MNAYQRLLPFAFFPGPIAPCPAWVATVSDSDFPMIRSKRFRGVLRQTLMRDLPKRRLKRSVVFEAIALAEIGGAGGAP